MKTLGAQRGDAWISGVPFFLCLGHCLFNGFIYKFIGTLPLLLGKFLYHLLFALADKYLNPIIGLFIVPGGRFFLRV